MTTTVIVLSGLPGAGKSTHVQKLIEEACARGQAAASLSADDFFTQPDGSWVFDPTKIGDAHAHCLKRFVFHCQEKNLDLCIVDNTNLSIAEIAPYMAIAQAYGHQAMVVRIKCPAEVAFTRQTHGVPLERFMHMFANQRELVLPPWWPTETVDLTPAPEELAEFKLREVYLARVTPEDLEAVRAGKVIRKTVWSEPGEDTVVDIALPDVRIPGAPPPRRKR